MDPLSIVPITTVQCTICNDVVEYTDCTTITASQFGMANFCESCWSFVFQAVYDSLAASGQIKSGVLDDDKGK
jgi:hypothetical protein